MKPQNLLRSTGRKGNSRKGNAMVEFALSVGLMMPLLLGVFQFGYAFYTYNRLVNAVREGARYASLRNYDSANSTPSSAYLASVKNAVVYGNPGGGTDPVVPGLTTGQVAVSMYMPDGVPDTVTVWVTNYTIDTIVKTLTWTNKPTASFRFEGRFATP